jgi:hypothetical protein
MEILICRASSYHGVATRIYWILEGERYGLELMDNAERILN